MHEMAAYYGVSYTDVYNAVKNDNISLKFKLKLESKATPLKWDKNSFNWLENAANEQRIVKYYPTYKVAQIKK